MLVMTLAYNHTRGDSALTPCTICRQARRRQRALAVLKWVAVGLVIAAGWTYAVIREIRIWSH
jgi:hypothetical protein